MKDWFKNLIGKAKPFPSSKQVIEFVFESGGVKYYRHVDEANMPYKRALKAISIYNELSMKCDRQYLVKHTQAFDNLLKAQKFGIAQLMELQKLNNQIKERITWVYDEDLVYKLASVRYFDENENPDDYDWKYAMQKIEHWKKSEDVTAFFLRQPIASLIPFLKDAEMNFATYSEANKLMNAEHLANISGNLLEAQKEGSSTLTRNLFWTEMNQDSAKSKP